MRDACVRLAASLLGYTILATPALAATNVASLAHGALITGPVNCSGSRGKPPVAIDGETRAYGRSWGYMWGYLNTPLVVRFRERVSINVVDMLLLDVDGRDYGYVIETSTEDGRWLPAVNRASARDKSWQTHRFTSRTTRSLRVTFTRTSVQARSYHVVEIAAYSLPKGVTETPLRRAWERPRFPIPPTDTQLLGAESVLRQLQDPDRVGQVRRLKPGAQARWDTDGDGVPDMLITREQAGVVVAVDDNGDMSATTEEADGTDDCLVIDLKGDGTLDRAVDYMDWDSSGFADTMVQTY
ncbi:MAG: hypothetical protein HON70_37855, partial [Lentisphaerae bacterium]|nr:hypothetical protein [Lentisphaerota bacterium]